MRKFADGGNLDKELALQYLTLFIGNDDWEEHVPSLFAKYQKNNSKEEALEKFRQHLSYAILLPTIERHLKIDEPRRLLFGANKFDGFEGTDWYEKLRKVVKKDVAIHEVKMKAIGLGIIDPIELSPYTRQAFNWLIDKAKETGALQKDNEADVAKSMRNIVYRYGGMVVSNFFTRHQDKVEKVVNWRTGYFVERSLFLAYPNAETMLKIKQAEINESPSKLIKKINVGV